MPGATHPGMNSPCACCVRSALLALWVWGGMPAPARAAESATRDEPAWISRAEQPGSTSSSHYPRAMFRSLGSLVLLIGALLAVNRWMRRRFAAGQPLAGSGLKVMARLRLGMRQEVVVVEWGGDQLVLGVGPSFIQPLHTRRGGQAEGGVRVQEEVVHVP